MNTRVRSLSLLAAVCLSGILGGCVYYNGMYNANRLAKSARKAEREGRTFEANNLWGQVATKAESVLVRHPSSKYAGQASVLRGVALARLGQCDRALGLLSQISSVGPNSDLAEDALLATGRCQAAQGNFAAGDAAYGQLLQSKNGDRRREARFQHARLLRLTGQYEEAVRALTEIKEPRADAERILALAQLGRVTNALALTDSMMARGDTTRRWDSLLVVLGTAHPAAASGLVDRMRRLPNRPQQVQARMLLEDGLRLARTDPVRAARRFRETIALGSTDDAPGRASLALVQLDLIQVRQPAQLRPILDTLSRLVTKYQLVSEEISRLRVPVAEIHRIASSVTPASSQGDLRLFLAAEWSRDALLAPRLAETLFRRVAEEWPTSPYAPKAILAAQNLNPGWVDTARALLEQQYYDSPYLATVRGETTPEYRQLEDSLAAFAGTLAVTKPAPVRRAPPPAAAERGRRTQPVP